MFAHSFELIPLGAPITFTITSAPATLTPTAISVTTMNETSSRRASEDFAAANVQYLFQM